ncbi:Cloroperoxidase [Mycena venus]|uniref:Cloroperoxidase n=1 Tax=Mycena venus TaxID=2733690 RepID=A0A8H7D8Q8_9AGAR|nr:Cloroperoxidase [Mycena venus]
MPLFSPLWQSPVLTKEARVEVRKGGSNGGPHHGSNHGSPPDPHAFIPAKSTDLRAPCPGLNTLANHGYLPRDGRNITVPMIVQSFEGKSLHGLRDCVLT